MEDLNTVFYGPEAGNKIEIFKKGMELIEKKYSECFKNRKPKYHVDNNDRLHNHYGIIVNSSGISLYFNNNSDLDIKIVDESRELFKKIFNS
tara:strand:+ start:139 stop:414 length:276 start_codon:yes stop_codon:yes gene_type:complete